MELTVIGLGRAGRHLALHAAACGQSVTVASRDKTAAATFAREHGMGVLAPGQAPAPESAVWIAVSDPALPSVAAALKERAPDSCFLSHASGLHGPEVFAGFTGPAAALHPPRPLGPDATGDFPDLAGTLWTVQCAAEHRDASMAMIRAWAGVPVVLPAMDRERRVAYHAACVMASSLAAAPVDAAAVQFGAFGLPAEVAARLAAQLGRFAVDRGGPLAGTLTGPLVRGDVAAVVAHLRALDPASESARLYRCASLWWTRRLRAEGRIGADTADALERALEPGP